MKFRILLNMPKFPTRKQARIIVACMVLHNFFRESRIRGRDFAMCDEYANYNPMLKNGGSIVGIGEIEDGSWCIY